MWKLLKTPRGYRQCYYQTMRHKSEEDALNSKFAESIRDFLGKVTLALDLRSKEAEELFSAATKKVEDSIKASNHFLNKEIEQAERSILEVARISKVQLESHKTCLGKYNQGIESIKQRFADKIRDCTEKTVLELETVRSRYEDNLEEVRDLKKLTKRALVECLDKKGNIKVCVETQNKSAHEKYQNLLDKLKSSSDDSIETIDQVLKSANVRFKSARTEVTETLPGVVEETTTCLKVSKESEKNSRKMFKSENNAEKGGKLPISIELSENENNSQDEKLECLNEARKDALNTINLVLHEIESSEKLTETIKKSNKKDPLVQEVLGQTHKLFQEAKQVIQKCTKNELNKEAEVDILKCLSNIFDSMKLKKFELIKKIEALKNNKKKSKVEIDKALEWMSSAEGNLQKLKEIFQECTKSEKK